LGRSAQHLEDAGVRLGADSIDDLLSNVAGGVHRGVLYEGRLELFATIDLDKTLGWSGATFHVNAYQTHGRGLSANDLGGNLLVASSIEATRSLRLFDAWVEQVIADGALSLRAGQIAADDEFFTSQYASTFINASFGWPGIMSADLPSGGAAFPLATPGARVKFAASNEVSLSAAVLNGDPAGAGDVDPQLRDGSGTAFRFGPSVLAIAEGAVALNQDSGATGQPATYKLGGWFNSGRFADQRFDTAGNSLAAPTTTGMPAQHHGDYGVYAIVEESVWRQGDNGEQSVGVFLRVAGAPSDRNLVSLYGDVGVAAKGLVPGRADDVFGVALAYAKISARARALDADFGRFTGVVTPLRDHESVLELTYSYQVTQWWTLQPDLQFVAHPGGNVGLPGASSGSGAIPNAVVLGLRSSLVF
jgi:porin